MTQKQSLSLRHISLYLLAKYCDFTKKVELKFKFLKNKFKFSWSYEMKVIQKRCVWKLAEQQDPFLPVAIGQVILRVVVVVGGGEKIVRPLDGLVAQSHNNNLGK